MTGSRTGKQSHACLLAGAAIAQRLREEARAEAAALAEGGRPPRLRVILVGENPASESYVSAKTKAAREAGIEAETIRLPADAPPEELLAEVERGNRDGAVNCRKAGVKIAFGTDAGGFPWTEINEAKEFEWEVKLGMSPLEAIRSATTVAAELLGLAGQIGTVEKGARADLVAVEGDPFPARLEPPAARDRDGLS